MEQFSSQENTSAITLQQCRTCHLPLVPSYYFCPNCGTQIKETPLETSAFAQIKLYAFSIILPMILFITIGKWKGGTYIQSADEKTRSIGIMACILLVLSTVLIIWFSIITVQKMTTEITNTISTNLDDY